MSFIKTCPVWRNKLLKTGIPQLPLMTRSFTSHEKVYGGENMDAEARKTFECWHKAVSTRDGNCVTGRVDPEVVFRPPTYFKPWKGEEEMKVILTCAAEVFGSSFKYKRQWLSPCGREWALEFETEIGHTGKIMNGIDLVSLVSSIQLFFFFTASLLTFPIPDKYI